MAVENQDIIACLAGRYPGPVATRALWLWAGGREADLDYEDNPLGQWQQLWTRVRDNDGTGVTPVAILRQALWDYPGNQTLMEALALYLPAPADPVRTALQLLTLRLEGLAPEFDAGRLWAALIAVGPLTVETAFAAVAPAFQGHFATAEGQDSSGGQDGPEVPAADTSRSTLEKQLGTLLADHDAADGQALALALGAFGEGLPEVACDGAGSLLLPLAAELKTVLAPLPPDVATLEQQVLPVIDRIHSAVAEVEAPLIRQAVIGIDNQTAALTALLENTPPQSIAALAEGCRQALWATTEVKSPDPC